MCEAEWNGSKGKFQYRRWLTESSVHQGYGVAAILTLVPMMTARVAAHRVAALHCPLWRTHTKAFDSRYRHCNRQHHLNDPFHRSRHRREWANRIEMLLPKDVMRIVLSCMGIEL